MSRSLASTRISSRSLPSNTRAPPSGRERAACVAPAEQRKNSRVPRLARPEFSAVCSKFFANQQRLAAANHVLLQMISSGRSRFAIRFPSSISTIEAKRFGVRVIKCDVHVGCNPRLLHFCVNFFEENVGIECRACICGRFHSGCSTPNAFAFPAGWRNPRTLPRAPASPIRIVFQVAEHTARLPSRDTKLTRCIVSNSFLVPHPILPPPPNSGHRDRRGAETAHHPACAQHSEFVLVPEPAFSRCCCLPGQTSQDLDSQKAPACCC